MSCNVCRNAKSIPNLGTQKICHTLYWTLWGYRLSMEQT